MSGTQTITIDLNAETIQMNTRNATGLRVGSSVKADRRAARSLRESALDRIYNRYMVGV